MPTLEVCSLASFAQCLTNGGWLISGSDAKRFLQGVGICFAVEGPRFAPLTVDSKTRVTGALRLRPTPH